MFLCLFYFRLKETEISVLYFFINYYYLLSSLEWTSVHSTNVKIFQMTFSFCSQRPWHYISVPKKLNQCWIFRNQKKFQSHLVIKFVHEWNFLTSEYLVEGTWTKHSCHIHVTFVLIAHTPQKGAVVHHWQLLGSFSLTKHRPIVMLLNRNFNGHNNNLVKFVF